MEHPNFYHPYAFIGIPGLAPGKGFEALRANWGFLLSVGSYAYAELRVRFRYNRFAQVYTFDDHQYMSDYHYKD
jgi:hypothetical protein